jgi:hypothetical protein
MLEKTTRIVSENLARTIDRRSFLKRTGQSAFLGLAALAAGQAMPSTARADGKQPPNISCAPPGPYCSAYGQPTDSCHGGNCFEHLYQGQLLQCRVYYGYQAGCWTTAQGGGYWTCCDCECGTPRITTCGCAQFSLNPVPRPDLPNTGQGAAA